jgi:hypothetical protein
MDMGDHGATEGTPEDRPQQPEGPPPQEASASPPMPSGPGWSAPQQPRPPAESGQAAPAPPGPPQAPASPGWNAQPPPPGGWNAQPPPPPGAAWPPPPPPPSGWNAALPGQGWTPPPPPPGQGSGWYAGPPGVPPPPPGWGAPPAGRGAAGLRPRGIGELLDGAFTLYRRNFLLLVAIAAVVQLPYAVVELIVYRLADIGGRLGTLQNFGTTINNQGGRITPEQTQQLTGDVGAFAVYIGVVLLVQYFIVYPLSLAATTHAVSSRYLDQPATVGGSYRAAFGMWRSLIAMVLLLALMIGGAFTVAVLVGVLSGAGAVIVLLLLPVMVFAVIVLVRTTVAAQTIVIERTGGRGGLQRSWRLTRGFFWRIVGILLVLGLLQAIVGGIVGLPVLALASGLSVDAQQMISQAISAVSAIFVAPVTLVTLTLLYYDLRIRREGFDLEMLIAAL